mgnify:CR=1 FL=1
MIKLSNEITWIAFSSFFFALGSNSSFALLNQIKFSTRWKVPNDSKVIITPSFRPTTPRMKLICSHDARCARPTVLAIREWLSTQGFHEGDIRSEARMSDDDMMMTPMMRGCDRGELSKQ